MDDVGEMPQQKKKEVEEALKLMAKLHRIAGRLKTATEKKKSSHTNVHISPKKPKPRHHAPHHRTKPPSPTTTHIDTGRPAFKPMAPPPFPSSPSKSPPPAQQTKPSALQTPPSPSDKEKLKSRLKSLASKTASQISTASKTAAVVLERGRGQRGDNYERERFIEKSGERDVQLYEKEKKGDIWAGLQLFGREVAATFGSFEGFKKPIEWWLHPTWGNEEKEVREYGKTYGKLSWKWSHSDTLGKAGMVVESPGGILASSLATGGATGLGVGAISRIAPTAGKVARAGLSGLGILSGGAAAYDVGRTAIVEKDTPKAIGKGIVYGLSFYGAGKLFKTGSTKGFKKAHVWWMSKHKPTFKQVITQKTPIRGGKAIAFKGFQEWSYKYSIGRKIHATVHFKGVFAPEKSPQFKPLYASCISTPKGKALVLEGVIPEGRGLTVSKGVGRVEYGFLKPKSKIFEITPTCSYGKSGRVVRIAVMSSEKSASGLVSSHSESRFLSLSREGISGGKMIFGESRPLRSGKPPVFVESTKYMQTKAWMKGVTASKEFVLPVRGTGEIIEPKGFFGGSESGLSGKHPSSILYRSEQLNRIIPPGVPFETGEVVKFKPTAVPILVFKKTQGTSQNVLKVETKRMPEISMMGGKNVQLVSKLETKNLQNRNLKTGLVLKQKVEQPRVRNSRVSVLSGTGGCSLSLKKTKSPAILKKATIPITSPLQIVRGGQKGNTSQIALQKPLSIPEVRLRMHGVTVRALKLEGVGVPKVGILSSSSAPVFLPSNIRVMTGNPSGKSVSIVKRKKKRKKSKRRRWKKTLLASPFAVEESYIKFGKATHPKPTRKLWEMGYRTMFKIPTVELMRRKKRRKKRR